MIKPSHTLPAALPAQLTHVTSCRRAAPADVRAEPVGSSRRSRSATRTETTLEGNFGLRKETIKQRPSRFEYRLLFFSVNSDASAPLGAKWRRLGRHFRLGCVKMAAVTPGTSGSVFKSVAVVVWLPVTPPRLPVTHFIVAVNGWGWG